MRVLVVEDDAEVGQFIATVVREAGHEPSIVTTGSQALTASLLSEFDLLICDLMLPDLQGTEIVRALKAQSPRLPVMVVSALDPDIWAQPCEDAGATRYFQKPLRVKDLRQELALVAKARLQLRIVVVDADPIHRTRLDKSLSALGCEVRGFASADETRRNLEVTDQRAGLLVVDAALPDSAELVRWSKARGLAAFVFAERYGDGDEDRFMRAGAAFMLQKPVDLDALLTQAAFLAI